jgi:hypothetical protein
MIIEFTGLPGSGKTFLRAAVAERLAEFGRPVVTAHVMRPAATRASGVGMRLLSAGCNPAVTTTVLRAALTDRRPLGERAFALRLTAVTLDNYQWLRDRSVTALMDEGFIQRGFLLFSGKPNSTASALAQHYALRIPMPDVVVHLRLDPAQAVTRTAGRSRSLPPRYARLTGDTLLDALRAGSVIIDQLLGVVTRRAGGPVVIDLDVSTVDDSWTQLVVKRISDDVLALAG